MTRLCEHIWREWSKDWTEPATIVAGIFITILVITIICVLCVGISRSNRIGDSKEAKPFNEVKEKERCIITTSCYPAGSGITSGDGIYDKDSKIILTATAKKGYEFSHWEDGCLEKSREVVAEKDADYRVLFIEQI